MSRSSTRVRSVLVAATVTAVGGVAAAPAAADPVAVGTGSTILTLTPGTTRAFGSLGIRATAIGASAGNRTTFGFPITGGAIDPKTAAGTLNHSGGLRLRKGGRQVRLTAFRVRVGRTSAISAKVNGGARVTVFSLAVGGAKLTTEGVQTTITRLRVQLTAAGARALNTTFGTRAFRGRQVVATARTAVFPTTLALTGGNTALTPDPATGRVLADLGIAVAPAPGATARPDGSIAFPISTGRLAAPSFAGEIPHTGGLTLTAGGTSVTLKDLLIDLDGSPTLSADVAGQRIEILDLGADDAVIKLTGRQLVIAGTKATLTEAAASALNRAFGTTAFDKGLTLGVASVHARIG